MWIGGVVCVWEWGKVEMVDVVEVHRWRGVKGGKGMPLDPTIPNGRAPPAVRWATEAAEGGAGSRPFLMGVPPQPSRGLQRRPWAALGIDHS